MGEERITDATDMLLSRGDGGAATDPRLDPLIYEEVRRLAGRIMRGERAHHTLQPTALANEAYMRLIDASRVQARDRNRFLALTAKAMRNILVDHARKRDAAKRGGGWGRVTLAAVRPDTGQTGAEGELDLLALDDALSELTEFDPRRASIVELRFFAGMAVKDIAEALDVSEATVRTDWYTARAWLASRIDPA